jgi:hypothetical protein
MGRGRIATGAISTSNRYEKNQAYYKKYKERLKEKQKETYHEQSKPKKIAMINKIIAEYDLKIKIKDDGNTSGQNA